MFFSHDVTFLDCQFHYFKVLLIKLIINMLGNNKFISGKLSFADGTDILPSEGKLLIFTAGEENVHWVDRVTDGVRRALTLFWTCDVDYGIDL